MQVSNETWFSIVVGGLLGWLLTHTYYLLQRKYLRPCFSIHRASVLDADAHDRLRSEIDVRFRGEHVPTLSVATVTFWNGGRKLLNISDVARLDPLRVELKGEGKILDTEVPRTTAIASGAEVVLDPSDPRVARITFDHLDVNQGFIVRVLHTAHHDQISVMGTVIGAQLESEQGTSQMERWGRWRSRMLAFIAAGFAFATVMLSQMLADAQGRTQQAAEVSLWRALKGEALERTEMLSALWLACFIVCIAVWGVYVIFNRSLRNAPPDTLR